MVIDNFDQILDILEFNNSDEFYFLQIIQRKKDGCVTDTGNNGYRTVKTYYKSTKELKLLNCARAIMQEHTLP